MGPNEDPFESPKSLVQWASDDVAKIDETLREWVETNTCTDVFEPDPNVPGGILHKFKLSKGVPPLLRRDVQRVTDEFKKALDQAMHHAIRLVDKEPRENVWFLWASDPDDLEKRLTNPRIPEILKPVFREIEPYPRGDHYPGGDNIFRVLGKVSGPSRHRTSLTVGTNATQQIAVNYFSGYSVMSPWDGAKNEVVIAGLWPDRRTDYEVDATLFVAFDHPELRHAPLDMVLHLWKKRVTEAVAAFERVAVANRKT